VEKLTADMKADVRSVYTVVNSSSLLSVVKFTLRVEAAPLLSMLSSTNFQNQLRVNLWSFLIFLPLNLLH